MATVKELRTGVIDHNNLIERLAADERIGLSKATLDAIMDKGKRETGAADQQVETFSAMIKALEAKYPNAVNYAPGAIL